MARTCIANRPGITSPSRTPRRPSIGFCSCMRRTAASSRVVARVRRPVASATRDLDREVLQRRQELVQRRVDQPDRHRQPVHRREDAVEVLALQRQQRVQRGLPIVLGGRPGSAPRPVPAGRRGTCARCGTARCPRAPKRRARAASVGVSALVRTASSVAGRRAAATGAPRRSAGRRRRPAVPRSTAPPGRLDRYLAEVDLAGGRRRSRSRRPRTVTPSTVNCRLRTFTSSASAPQTHVLPIPRATTAAWVVLPPREVRMPWAAIMPGRSSGLVSRRTRITFSPCAASSTARRESKTTLPTAAPGRGGDPVGERLVGGRTGRRSGTSAGPAAPR